MTRKIKIIKTNEFNKNYSKLDTSVKKQIDKQIEYIINSKGNGKSLYKNIIFERKVESYRIYYIKMQQEIIILIFVSIHKKHSSKSQQEQIDLIKEYLDIYLSEFQL